MKRDWDDNFAPLAIKNLPDIVLDNVGIIDIITKYGIEVYPHVTGGFSHRLRCPLPVHKGGAERTPSFYVDSESNKFYCFGCNFGGGVVDFVMYYEGTPYFNAMAKLANLLNISKDCDLDNIEFKKRERRDPSHYLDPYIYDAGVMIRDYIQSLTGTPKYEEELKWADKEFDILEKYMDRLEDSDWEKVKFHRDDLAEKIKQKISK